MADLLQTLAGEELAKLMDGAELTRFQVFKEDRKVHIGLLCSRVLGRTILDSFCQGIKTSFELTDVDLTVTYKPSVLTADTVDVVYENLLEEVFQKLPATRGVLVNSYAVLEEGSFVVHLKFGGEKALLDNGVDTLLEKKLKEVYHTVLSVTFCSDALSTEAIFEKVESQREELIRGASVAAAAAELAAAKPVVEKREKPDAPEDLLLGKPFGGALTPIVEINENSGRVIIEGRVVAHETRELKNKKILLELYVADAGSCMICKAFLSEQQFEPLKANLKKLNGVRVSGMAQYDTYAKEVVIIIRDIMKVDLAIRPDHAEEKRVELHAHTVMSTEDALVKPKDLIARAAAWGHKAVAITDHGVVQAYPEAYDAGQKHGIKIIYGMEAYLEADVPAYVMNETSMPLSGNFVVFDIETTSLSARYGEIIEIAGVKISGGKIAETFSKFVKPNHGIPYHITELTNISNDMVREAEPIDIVLPAFLEFCAGCVLVAHNAAFDVGYIKKKAEEQNLDFSFCYVDTLALSRRLLTGLKTHKLNRVAKHLGFSFEGHHRAINDAEVTARIFLHFMELMVGLDVQDVSQINSRLSTEHLAKYADTYHAVILVQNMVGLKNLYKLVSFSHLDHFYKRPRISKNLFDTYREGLLLGSACEAGELYQKMLRGATEQELWDIAAYYDYLEIQPLGNNEFMIRSHMVDGREELEDMNRTIVALGDALKKRVVAAGDVHFLDATDEVYRRVLQTAKGYDDADRQAPLYLRTTEEMLSEFSYLPKEKAYEIVVTNTNLIAEEIGEILPIPKETYPPEMPGATEELQELSYRKAHELYGDTLPQLVQDRIDKELVPIIKYGFSVMYMIAQKLVAKSLSDGYLVGSRGSVGSSFVAYLSGITEINSLPPHYLCPHCKQVEFVLDGSYSMGADMPDKVCPSCGTKYKKDGYDIPFETFLGFDGDKEPDIDLNFSGEYQSVAHKYTETLFGEGNVFRAGTIGTLAENTAMGYVKKYAEATGISLTKAQMKQLSLGLEGVKRTTGQHPGGVMIVPRANEVYEFTPIQHPANDSESHIITTHFDYHSISGRLLKLDILGHDDPSVIRMLEDLTGLDARSIPIDDKATMSLFTSTDALGVTPEDIGSEVGTFAVPEFGTRFVRQMLLDTKPTTFSELIRISGLSHGTDVWTNNAQDLVRNGVATLPEVICTRDDIMLYLLQHDVPPLTSFKIMEKVRKGKGLTPEDEALMREKKVPDWYITSCKTIKYMFPKAHAAAYVTMAFRIAYFKVHYPISFYIAYYTVRATDFDAERMLGGKDRVMAAMREIEANPDATQKEKNVLTILEVCNEMYARGIEFLPVDLYASHQTKFLEEKGAIRPPLNAIAGVSDAVAEMICTARAEGAFLSIEDLKRRAKIGNSVAEKLQEFHVLKDIPDTNQVSLFDMG
ncbi:MAG: PolC-type DNA polymerase III [Ruminococcaceae bacterium]|nr:PolC-type DNA polymerase III [Oscillospiraceae bacterium]